MFHRNNNNNNFYFILLNYRLYGNLSKICASAAARQPVTNPTAAAAAVAMVNNNNTQIREYHEVVGDILCPSQVMGIDHIRDPRLNKVSMMTLLNECLLGSDTDRYTHRTTLVICHLSIRCYILLLKSEIPNNNIHTPSIHPSI